MLIVENLIDLKNKNLKSIIDHERFRQSDTKRQIAADLNLSFATVSNMINLLMRIGLFEETNGLSSKYVGRSPKYLKVNSGHSNIITIDLHNDKDMTMCSIDLARRIQYKKTVELLGTGETSEFIKKITDAYRGLLSENGIREDKIIGVGVIIPGTFDARSDLVVGTEKRVICGKPLRRLLEEVMGKTIIPENDASLAAYYSAVSSGIRDLTYVYLSDGVGMGTVTGGNILRGINGYSSEIAHAPLGVLNRKCPYCGNTDCLQNDLSRNGFLSKYYARLLPFDDQYEADWYKYIERVQENDEKAVEVARGNAVILGKALATAAGIVRPARVVIGGLPEVLYRQMQPVIEKAINSREPYDSYVEICYDGASQDTFALGAAEMVYEQWSPNLDMLLGDISDEV